MDGVQRILVLSFTARTRNASRGREAPEEWASLLFFIFSAVLFSGNAAAAEQKIFGNLPAPPPPVIDKSSQLYQAAKGMEVQFMQEMMRKMRKSVPDSPEMQHNQGFQVFRGMLDDHYAEQAARVQGIGLAEIIVRQVLETQAPPPRAPVAVREVNKSDVLRK